MKFECNEHNGRFIVVSSRTGRKYFVEPIGSPRSDWGDVDPATKKTTGSYGAKYKGSISEKDSVITVENGFEKITYTGIGHSPMALIEKMDSKYPNV